MRTESPSCLRIALQIEKNRAHGRSLLEGVADYSLERTDWRLELVDPEILQEVSSVRKFDGLIVRVMDDATAEVLRKSQRPVVDTYGHRDDNPFPSIRLDDAAIADVAFKCFAEHHYRTFAYCNAGRTDEVRRSRRKGCGHQELCAVAAGLLAVGMCVVNFIRIRRVK